MPAPRKGVTVEDLRAIVAARPTAGYAPRILLLCQHCGEECSANPSDYFLADPRRTLKHCRRVMTLVRKVVNYESVQVPGRP